MKILKGFFIVVFTLIIIVVVVIFIGLKYFEYRNTNYYKYATPLGDVEKKYTPLGDYEIDYVEFDANNEIYDKFEIWYPAELDNTNTTYPLVIMANGTGIKASKYKEVFKHLASWGFIVVGNEDENSRSGKSSSDSLDFMIELNKNSDHVFYNKIDLNNVGIGGHSQGGVGAINALTNYNNGIYYKAIYTASTTSPYWGQENILGLSWTYDSSNIKIPYFMVAGTGYADAGTAMNINATKGQGICPIYGMLDTYNSIPNNVNKVMGRQVGMDHGDMLRSADGYMTAWFMYYLKGDKYAGTAFIGNDAEILYNLNWQDVKKND